MKVTVLGCGTSLGVPVVGCTCKICTGGKEKNQRLRASLLLTIDGRNIVIDTTPDFRTQCLKYNLTKLDTVLLTHAHADHIHGLDDIRPFNFIAKSAIDVYCDQCTEQRVRTAFAYMFTEHDHYGSLPKANIHNAEQPFSLFGQPIIPLPVGHGNWTILGFRFGKFAYVTDTNFIPEETIEQLRDLDVLILDALQFDKHPTHFSLAEALEIVARVKPRQTFLTHMSHEMDYDNVNATLPKAVMLAHDGLTFEV